MKVPENNYGLIARNCGYFYYYLNTFHDNLFTNRLHILVMTGLLDGMAYIEEGQITKEDIAQCVVGALSGRISVRGLHIGIGDSPDILWTESGVYLSFLMNFETLLLSKDNPLIKTKNVAESVLASAHEISAAAEAVRTEILDSGYPEEAKDLVEKLLADPKFSGVLGWLNSLKLSG